MALENLQYLDNHEPQRFDFCIECTPTDRTCQLYHHQVKIMIIYEGTNNLVSGAFLKCFSILYFRTEQNAHVKWGWRGGGVGVVVIVLTIVLFYDHLIEIVS